MKNINLSIIEKAGLKVTGIAYLKTIVDIIHDDSNTVASLSTTNNRNKFIDTKTKLLFEDNSIITTINTPLRHNDIYNRTFGYVCELNEESINNIYKHSKYDKDSRIKANHVLPVEDSVKIYDKIFVSEDGVALVKDIWIVDTLGDMQDNMFDAGNKVLAKLENQDNLIIDIDLEKSGFDKSIYKEDAEFFENRTKIYNEDNETAWRFVTVVNMVADLKGYLTTVNDNDDGKSYSMNIIKVTDKDILNGYKYMHQMSRNGHAHDTVRTIMSSQFAFMLNDTVSVIGNSGHQCVYVVSDGKVHTLSANKTLFSLKGTIVNMIKNNNYNIRIANEDEAEYTRACINKEVHELCKITGIRDITPHFSRVIASI